MTLPVLIEYICRKITKRHGTESVAFMTGFGFPFNSETAQTV